MSTDVGLNPFEVDLSQIDAQLAEIGKESGEEPVVKTEGEETKPDAAKVAGQETKAPEDAAAKKEDAEQAVLARDGKSVIPFSVLESARSQAKTNAELAAKERGIREALERELESLRAQAANGSSAPAAGSEAHSGLTDEKISELEEEAPELAKMFKGMQAELAAMKGQIHEFQEKSKAIDQLTVSAQANADATVQDVIDSDPRLTALQSDPVKFNKLVDIDDGIRQNPEFVNLSLPERIAKSLELYQVMYGKVEAPDSVKREAQTKSPASSTVVSEPVTKARPNVPNTLSDLPAGGLPSNSIQDTIAGMSVAALTAKMMDMTPADQEKFLAQMTS